MVGVGGGGWQGESGGMRSIDLPACLKTTEPCPELSVQFSWVQTVAVCSQATMKGCQAIPEGLIPPTTPPIPHLFFLTLESGILCSVSTHTSLSLSLVVRILTEPKLQSL